MEQIVDFPFSGGGRQDFRPGQSSSCSSHFPAGVHDVLDEPREGFFRTFLLRNTKKCEGHPALECESAPRHQLIHADLSSNGSP